MSNGGAVGATLRERRRSRTVAPIASPIAGAAKNPNTTLTNTVEAPGIET
jgi:hypothetical protein